MRRPEMERSRARKAKVFSGTPKLMKNNRSTRRLLLQTLGLTAAHQTLGCGGADEPGQLPLEALRASCMLQARPLAADRLQSVRPAVERNLAQIEAVRRFEFDDRTEPIAIFRPRG